MGYVTVTGGRDAIEASTVVGEYFRLHDATEPLAVSEIRSQLRLLIDRVMGDAGFYAPGYAALAVKQSEGDALEAAFMLRAYRSTLERRHRTLPLDLEDMRIIRRISSAFRDVPGGQVLGPTTDYAHRLLNFALGGETPESIRAALSRADALAEVQEPVAPCPHLSERLRQEGILPPAPPHDETAPSDVTREKLVFPASRSARLQTLARGETGVLTALAYSSMRGYGAVHPTVGELRVGAVALYMEYPYGDDDGAAYYVGDLLMTEVESINAAHTDDPDEAAPFTLGYGLSFGQNEVKAIAMSIVDRSLDTEGAAPAQDEEFVLSHIDSVDSMGFVSHLKLPHYVTFQSSLDRARETEAVRRGNKEASSDDSGVPVVHPAL